MKTKFYYLISAVLWAASVGLFTISCQDDDGEKPIKVKSTSSTMSIHRGDVIKPEFESGNYIVYKTSNPFVVKIDHNKPIGNHVGTCYLFAENNLSRDTIEVTVVPQYDILDEPILDLGISRREVLDREQHNLLSLVSDSTDLAYDYSKDIARNLAIYAFAEGTDSLRAVVVAMGFGHELNDNEFTMIQHYFNERYRYLEYSTPLLPNAIFFVNSDEVNDISKGIVVRLYRDGLILSYHNASVNYNKDTGEEKITIENVNLRDSFNFNYQPEFDKFLDGFLNSETMSKIKGRNLISIPFHNDNITISGSFFTSDTYKTLWER